MMVFEDTIVTLIILLLFCGEAIAVRRRRAGGEQHGGEDGPRPVLAQVVRLHFLPYNNNLFIF
jgi:hypothetical protein